MIAITDDTYIFTETEDENVFLFYRNDGNELGDVGDLPKDFFDEYIMRRMMFDESDLVAYNNIYFKKSEDGKSIRIITSDVTRRSSRLRSFFERFCC